MQAWILPFRFCEWRVFENKARVAALCITVSTRALCMKNLLLEAYGGIKIVQHDLFFPITPWTGFEWNFAISNFNVDFFQRRESMI